MNVQLEVPAHTLVIKREDLEAIILKVVSQTKTEDKILNIKEAATLLQVSVPTMRNFIESGGIPHFRHGQVIRFKKNTLMDWFDSR